MKPTRNQASRFRRAAFCVAFVAGMFKPRFAVADEPTAKPPEPTPVPLRTASAPMGADDTAYAHYGVSLAVENVLSPGRICDFTGPCILGSGGGIVARGGYRSASPWYLGGAYELTKQDPNNLYRLATLQQFRVELRYYLDTGRDLTPFVTSGVGLAGYGNEWRMDTWGPLVFLGAGLEYQVERRFVLGVQASYRALATRRFEDPGGLAERPGGIASFFAIEFAFEWRVPLKK